MAYRVYSHETIKGRMMSQCIFIAKSEHEAIKFVMAQNLHHPSAMWNRGELHMLRIVDDTTIDDHVWEFTPEDGEKVRIGCIGLSDLTYGEDYVDYDLREDPDLLKAVTGQRKPIEGYDEQKLYRQLLRRRAKDEHD